ncbi:hypothetical protein NL676_003721 [Syzygium grande]|nr:hypothetical protein NL676_003721 [Syzygium grande]
MKEAIVLYPSPAIGHLISMVEFGKLLLTHRPSLSIHVLITNQAYDAGSTTAYIASVSGTVPSIAFHYFPATTLPGLLHDLPAPRDPCPRAPPPQQPQRPPHPHHYLGKLFARELNIPCYYFFTSGAGYLNFFLYVPTLHDKFAKSFKDFDAPIDVPGTPPIPPSDIAKPMQDRYDEAYKGFLDSSVKMQTSAGIIVNTFEKLELRAIRAIMAGECVPGRPTPPLYCIGPLISSREEQRHNRVLLVQEMRIALPVDELEDGRVSSDEVEKRVRELMESEEGKTVRERVLAMKEEAMAALSPGGSSLSVLAGLIESWKRE